MTYSLFYRHNSSCTVFWVSSFHLSVNIVVLPIHGHWSRISKTSRLKLKREVSRTQKKFKIAIMFLGRRRRSREESPEWICESTCLQVSVRLHVFAGFFGP